MPFKALIVGGAGGMGQWCARIFKEAGYDVSISSRRDVFKLAKEMGVGIASPKDAGDFDVVVLSVPIDAIDVVSADISPRMKKWSLLMDLSSLKKGPLEAMLSNAPAGVEVLGAHPLFGPSTDMKGRTIVLVPGRCPDWFPVIYGVFESAGLRVEVTTAEDHDSKMAVVQGLTHFMYIAMGRALKDMGVSMESLDGYQTPVYSITKDLMGRVLSGDPRMYSLIQSGGQVKAVRDAYMEACARIAMEADHGDIDAVMKDIASAARHFGDVDAAKRRTDLIFEKSTENKLFIQAALGTEAAFYVEGEPGVTYGVIKEMTHERFVLDTPSKTLTLRYDEARPAGPEALEQARKKLAKKISRDVYVTLGHGASPAMIRWVLTRIDGIADVASNIHDDEKSTHRFTIEMYADRSDDTLRKALDTITGLGFNIK